jgi:hypothetical protein
MGFAGTHHSELYLSIGYVPDVDAIETRLTLVPIVGKPLHSDMAVGNPFNKI